MSFIPDHERHPWTRTSHNIYILTRIDLYVEIFMACMPRAHTRTYAPLHIHMAFAFLQYGIGERRLRGGTRDVPPQCRRATSPFVRARVDDRRLARARPRATRARSYITYAFDHPDDCARARQHRRRRRARAGEISVPKSVGGGGAFSRRTI